MDSRGWHLLKRMQLDQYRPAATPADYTADIRIALRDNPGDSLKVYVGLGTADQAPQIQATLPIDPWYGKPLNYLLTGSKPPSQPGFLRSFLVIYDVTTGYVKTAFPGKQPTPRNLDNDREVDR